MKKIITLFFISIIAVTVYSQERIVGPERLFLSAEGVTQQYFLSTNRNINDYTYEWFVTNEKGEAIGKTVIIQPGIYCNVTFPVNNWVEYTATVTVRIRPIVGGGFEDKTLNVRLSN